MGILPFETEKGSIFYGEGDMKNKGILYAFLAYGGWALISIYWKQIDHSIDAVQITSHRIFWSLITLIVMLGYTGRFSAVKEQIKDKKSLWTFVLSALLLTANWTIYIYAVVAGHIIETSLGYFINPLVNVLIGVFFFHEPMRKSQWLAVAVAAAGVLYLTIALQAVPLIPLGLALTFGFYGFVKKKVKADSMVALTFEAGVMFIPALLLLINAELHASATAGSFLTADLKDQMYLFGAGLVTTIPLIWFAKAVKSVPFTTLGFIQYLTPSTTFLIGLLIYHEPFSSVKLIGYAIVWVGVLIFVGDNIWNNRKKRLVEGG